MQPLKEGIAVTFHHEYLHRDQISQEEIAEEGFSADDDFSWSGKLPAIWIDVLKELLASTSTLQDLSEDQFQDSYLFLDLDDVPDLESGYPANGGDWQYKAEEVIQAIYEVSGKEKPFYLAILDQSRDQKIEIHAVFAERSLTLERNGQKETKPWSLLSQLLLVLENLELPEEKAKPARKGTWLTFDQQAYLRLLDEDALALHELL